MTKYEKILAVLLFGSLLGATELFGRDFLRAIGVEEKSAILFGMGLILLYVSKRLVHFPGSVVIMALIAGVFKTASSHFFPCQFAAVLINGVVFDIAYSTLRHRLDGSLLTRTVAAPVIVYVSYAFFAIVAAYVLREGPWASGGWTAIRSFLEVDAAKASVIAIVAMNLGYYLGNVIQPRALPARLPLPTIAFRIVSVMLVAAIWIAGQVY